MELLTTGYELGQRTKADSNFMIERANKLMVDKDPLEAKA